MYMIYLQLLLVCGCQVCRHHCLAELSFFEYSNCSSYILYYIYTPPYGEAEVGWRLWRHFDVILLKAAFWLVSWFETSVPIGCHFSVTSHRPHFRHKYCIWGAKPYNWWRHQFQAILLAARWRHTCRWACCYPPPPFYHACKVEII